jgi:hypothetical protein
VAPAAMVRITLITNNLKELTLEVEDNDTVIFFGDDKLKILSDKVSRL